MNKSYIENEVRAATELYNRANPNETTPDDVRAAFYILLGLVKEMTDEVNNNYDEDN